MRASGGCPLELSQVNHMYDPLAASEIGELAICGHTFLGEWPIVDCLPVESAVKVKWIREFRIAYCMRIGAILSEGRTAA